MSKVNQRGLLLINLGTPKSPEPNDVGVYLNEFLMDKNVITLPYILRWILVHILIVPLRKFKSSLNYKKVWTDKGSPLLVYTQRLTTIIRNYKKEYQVVEFGMRYGNPSILQSIKKFKDVDQIDVIALYPHLTKSSVITAIDEVKRCLKKERMNAKLNILPVFYNEEFYIDSMEQHILEQVGQKSIDESYFVFSYHGIPASHLDGVCPTLNSQDKLGCCDTLNESNRNCYRAQCFETTRLISKGLGIEDERSLSVFQSRLGRARWISPNITDVIPEMAKLDKQNVVFLSPSFVADCLETLEELGMGIKSDYETLVPSSVVQVLPCLNDNEKFARSLADWAFDF